MGATAWVCAFHYDEIRFPLVVLFRLAPGSVISPCTTSGLFYELDEVGWTVGRVTPVDCATSIMPPRPSASASVLNISRPLVCQDGLIADSI